MLKFTEWLDPTGGLKPHRYKHDSSFNNIVFSAELLVGLELLVAETGQFQEELNTLENHTVRHITKKVNDKGIYIPKNSHDNQTALVVVQKLLQNKKFEETANLEAFCKGKHPRDRAFYHLALGKSFSIWHLAIPFMMLDMIRAIYDVKVRPKFWERRHFWKRVRCLFKKPKHETKDFMGKTFRTYMLDGEPYTVVSMQNDGKILNLLRLHYLKDLKGFGWFAKLCKFLYVRQLGKAFQSKLFANYFEEVDHPVREVYRLLDEKGLSVID